MYVTKASGEREPFNRDKIIKTCLRSGAIRRVAEQIADEVESRTHDGDKTKDILSIVLALLEEKTPSAAQKYDLKGAIMRLGPSGFPFELFVSEVLREYDYSVELRKHIMGKCIEHEIDIIVSEGKKKHMVECKYHNYSGVYTGIKDALYVYARFLDINERGKFDSAWLVCNTKFSDDAIKYAQCKGMRLLGWGYPESNGLEKMIEKKKLYPVTMIHSLKRPVVEKLVENNLLLVKDLFTHTTTQLSALLGFHKRRVKELMVEAEAVIHND
ncbi:MAG: restriction endonuclease [Candidatus Aenigmarchaeota archaeon]|nr:restriction endonuclease [Candidatus Aenigmarchaeota archaeon]